MNLKVFKKKLRSLYASWEKNKQDLWGGSDVLLISSPPIPSPNSVSTRFYVWLLGYVFADTIAIFTFKEIHFICNRKNASQLRSLTSSAEESVHAQLVVHVKAKGDLIMDRVVSDLRLQQKCKYISLSYSKNKSECDIQNANGPSIIVGHVEGESPTSNLLFGSSMKKKLNEFQTVDIKDRLSRFAPARADNDVDENKEQQKPVPEQVVWGFKHSEDDPGLLLDDSSESDCQIFMQPLSKVAEEGILLAEVKGRDEFTCRRRHGTKAEAVCSEATDATTSLDEMNEWILV